MDIKISGIITNVLPHKSGVSQKTGNPWEIAEYVLTTEEQRPKHICFQVSNPARIQEFNLKQNERVTLSIDIDAREYNGRWFNSISAYRVDRGQNNVQNTQKQPAPDNELPF